MFKSGILFLYFFLIISILKGYLKKIKLLQLGRLWLEGLTCHEGKYIACWLDHWPQEIREMWSNRLKK